MKKQQNIPELRFPEFEEDWERKKIIDFAPLQRGFDLPVNKIRDGKYPVVFSNGILKYHNEYKVKGPGVVTGRSGTIGKVTYVEDNFWAHNTSLWVTNFNENHPKFVYYFYCRYNLENFATGSGVPTLNRNDIHCQKEYFPYPIEQQKIASFFTAIDQKISQLKQKKSLLEQYKRGVMQKIFSQEIRFRDKNGHEFPKWEKKRLGELTLKTGRKNKENIKYPIYSINNKEGFLPQSDQFEGMNSNDRGYNISLYKIIMKDTFAYNPARINVGSIGFSGNLENIIISSLYVCFKTTEKLEDSFLLHFLKTYQFYKSVLQNVEGGVRDYLFYETFSNIKIHLPSIQEQILISKFLTAIDDKIIHTQTQIEKAELWKKGLLQKIFV